MESTYRKLIHTLKQLFFGKPKSFEGIYALPSALLNGRLRFCSWRNLKGLLMTVIVNLLAVLEKNGIKHGLATYVVLIDWLGQSQLIDEAKALLEKFTEKGVPPSLDVHVSLCDMYARVHEEKKTLQARVLENKKDKLKYEQQCMT
ncbi:hypothetical protein SSX86_003917 [Deinandra increscens subsp. villosa]|uniref:Pentatricopeptide repeat-containing protein n=1 Tax=Deinandra increscens subsp. villosa TaxID=3103831 RepID=A0AAP0DJ89_9ASTR